MADHRTLASVNVHEPKHISDATSADAGKVITPSVTSGVSELRLLTPDEVGINFTYGEMQLSQNTTSFSITAATDPTLYTDSDYVLINSVRAPGVTLDQNNGVTLDNVNNTLNAPTTGIYRISGWFNIESDTINSKMAISYTNNGVVSGLKPKHDIKEVSRVQNISAFGLISATAGDDIGIAVACDKTANITLQDFNIMLELVEAS